MPDSRGLPSSDRDSGQMIGADSDQAHRPPGLADAFAMDVLRRYDVPVVVIGEGNEVRWTSDGAERRVCAIAGIPPGGAVVFR